MYLPELPTNLDGFIPYLAGTLDTTKALAPFKAYDAKLREVYAQDPDNNLLKSHYINTVRIFAGHEGDVKTRARNLDAESTAHRNKYLLPLSDNNRRPDGSPAIVTTMKEFKTNFNLFSESALVDLDWSNIVAAGSSVVTALLPVKSPHNQSKRALRAYYHEKLAPASDVDLFIYGLDEEKGIEKIKQIEARIRDSILSETTTIRTKNAITIVSEYPTRHVQIVLRLYKSISEMLTGFDVDCSCVAYDGKEVWAAPRAIAAFMTQTNAVDLTRRSPSYENRLSKYSHRGFEVFWPELDRSRIDPTIFERSFSRVMGLARLLVLEKLPHPNDRDTYLAKRREERGRPPLPWNARYRHQLPGNIKDSQPDDVAEWVEEDDVSNYHTFTVPYGPKYNAKRTEKLLFTKDLLLNAEWNRPKAREANLHRHPAFFGSVDDIIHDCCGFCPVAETDEDLAAFEEEDKIYVSGEIAFIKDNPGRQAIGSFNPLTDDNWTEMAYVGNTARLCQAIVDCDLEGVQDWFTGSNAEEVNVDERDLGAGLNMEHADVNRRDHTGRTPLHLATMCSTAEIVQYLIDHGARIVARLVDGITALHIAAHRGEIHMVKSLLEKSNWNEAEEDRKKDARKDARNAAREGQGTTGASRITDAGNTSLSGSDSESIDEVLSHEVEEGVMSDHITEGSFVKVEVTSSADTDDDDGVGDPDVYDVDVLAWDAPVSPLHLAILGGHVKMIELLVDEFGADILLPVKLVDEHKNPRAAILSIVLALRLPLAHANETVQALLSRGASSAQADMDEFSALHYVVSNAKSLLLDTLFAADHAAALKAAKHVLISGWRYKCDVETPLLTAIKTGDAELVEKLLTVGCETEISFEIFAQAYQRKFDGDSMDPAEMKKIYQLSVNQPIIEIVRQDMPDLVEKFLGLGVDANTLPRSAWERRQHPDRTYAGKDESLLDIVQAKLEEFKGYLAPPKTEELKPPPQLEKESNYLLELHKGSYRYWAASYDLKRAHDVEALQIMEYKNAIENSKPQEAKGEAEKRKAVQELMHKFIKIEKILLSKGAKSFYEIFPDINRPALDDRRGNYYNHIDGNKKDPYSTNLSFMVPDLTDSKRERYCRLFEAAWTGELDTVKHLTLTQQAGLAPLQVAVQDLRGFSPFSIAVLRGHEELASTLLEIATLQYHPEEKASRYKYSMPTEDSDEGATDVDSDDDVLRVHGELIDEVFTVDDIAAISENVKSKVSPMTLLTWQAEAWRPVDDNKSAPSIEDILTCPGLDTNVWIGNASKQSWAWFNAVFDKASQTSRCSLIRLAIAKNNMGLLKYLLKTGGRLATRKEDEEASKVFSVSQADFDLAARLGRTEMIGEIIKSTGAGIPLQKLVQKSGVLVQEKPKYYQGLSVHGQKRKDWAEAGRRGTGHSPIENDHAPLLSVAFEGNLETVEYYLSDAPLRRYMEFAEAHQDDKRLQTLTQAEGGIDKALSTWMGMRTNLAIHMAVMSKPGKDAVNPLLEFLIRNMPESIDAKSTAGNTPLQIAFALGRYHAAKMLIAAGANQTTRNNNGENLLYTTLHHLAGNGDERVKQLNSWLALLDKSVIRSMTVEKCGGDDPGSLTPLARCLKDSSYQEVVAPIILEHSGGKDLEAMDGAGDYPLHALVRSRKTELARYIINYNPALLYWENATGMTPLDVVNTSYLRDRMDNPPSIGRSSNRHLGRRPNSSDQRLLSRDPRSFTMTSEELQKEADNENTAYACWKMCNEEAARYPDRKRKLVSLFDANEVAKRLARQQQIMNEENRRRERMGLSAGNTGGRYRENGGEEQIEDEVGQWMGKARD